MSDRRASGTPWTVTQLLAELDDQLRSGDPTRFKPIPIGFTAFDEAVGGGLRRGDLTIFAGPPGVGKTILGLQAARHLAAAGRPAIVVCYEHDRMALLLRLLAQSTGTSDPRGRVLTALKQRLELGSTDRLGLADILVREPALARAFGDLQDIGDDLVLVAGSGRGTDLAALHDVVIATRERTERNPVLIVDHLQKVPTDDHDGAQGSRRVVEGLKDLAMQHHIPVVALASLNATGLETRRLRLSHLADTSSIAFEADVVVLLNDKVDAVAKAHVSYGGAAALDYPNWVVWGIAKNRSGPNLLNLEFRKDFRHFRYEPAGRQVAERLADDRLDGDAS